MIDVCGYGILENHQHSVLRNRPDLVRKLSDESVIRAWWEIAPEYRINGKPGKISQKYVDEHLQDAEWLAERRRRLSCISWFMWSLKHPFALAVNANDGTAGHVWASRFKAKQIKTQQQLLSTLIYVDLNAIRAGSANSILESEYTSGYDRARSIKRRRDLERKDTEHSRSKQKELADYDGVARQVDDWLSPIYLEETYGEVNAKAKHRKAGAPVTMRETAEALSAQSERREKAAAEATPFVPSRPRASDLGLLPMSTEKYLYLVDLAGRRYRPDKRGKIPDEMDPILSKLGLGPPADWLQCFDIFMTEADRKILARGMKTNPERLNPKDSPIDFK